MSLRTWLFALGALVLSVVGWGQGNLGGLTGYISDTTGAAIAEATVTLNNLETGAAFPAVSTSEGVYRIAGLPPGKYQVSVTKPGFRTFQKEPVIVSTETVSTLDVTLTVGDVTQSVVVTGGEIQLQTCK